MILTPTITQAERWKMKFLDTFANRTDITTEAQCKPILERLMADFPHVEILLTKGDHVIGKRRIFGDRSNCDMWMHCGQPQIACDTMSQGRLGVAHNGNVIE